MSDQYQPETLYITGTIVIGLGGTGVETVRLIKARVRQASVSPPHIIEFLAVDTESRLNAPGKEHLSQGEYAYLGDYNARRVLEELDAHPHIKSWWFDERDIVTGTIHKGARQRRPVGRLSLYVNWGEFSRTFDAKAHHIQEIVRRERAQRAGLNVQRADPAKVYIISSLCGGTGSSIFLDVAFRVRQFFNDEADIMGVFLLPSCFLPENQSTKQQRRIQGNAYASLIELNHFMKGAPFQAVFPHMPYQEATKDKEVLYRPFDTLYLIDRSNGKEKISNLDQIRHMIAQQVYLDIVTPIGASIATRRANQQTLAGESSKKDKESQAQSLAIGSFATASLVLPSDRLTAAASRHFAANHIRARFIGRSPDSDQLERTVETRFNSVNQKLRFEKEPDETPTSNEDDSDFLVSEPLESANIDLSRISDVINQVYLVVGEDLHQDFKTYGLKGVFSTLTKFINKSEERLREIRNILTNENHQLTAISEELSRPAPRVGFWSRIRGQADQLQNEWSTRQSDLEEERGRLQRHIRRDEQSQKALNDLTKSLNEIRQNIVGNDEKLKALAKQLEEEAEDLVNRLTLNQQLKSHHQDADLFELATLVGHETYYGVDADDGLPFEEHYWKRVYKQKSQDVSLSGEDEENIARLAAARLFPLSRSEAAGDYRMTLPQVTAQELKGIWTVLDTAFQRSSHRQFDIVAYLHWFYRNIRHGRENEARFSPLDPLQMLHLRCQEPFLEIDRARLGTEGGNDTEPIRVLGIPTERSKDKSSLLADILIDFDSGTWEDVPTGLWNRIDISYSRMGYPVRVLRDLHLFKKSYEHFQKELLEKMHPHRDWPNGMDVNLL